ncbi:unnamed protein product [Peniophora sp. CBMAI 1063]|nr:unnamed protein product [Peniophora sp. CBMAI 1063]
MKNKDDTGTRHWDPFVPFAARVIEELQHSVGDDYGPILSPMRSMASLKTMAPVIGQPTFPNREILYLKVTSVLWLLAELIEKQKERHLAPNRQRRLRSLHIQGV